MNYLLNKLNINQFTSISNGMKNFLLSFFILSVLVVPVFAFAYTYNNTTGLIPCDGSANSPCDFNALMSLVNNVIGFVLFYLAMPISAIMFAYAGFLMVTAGESASEARTKAKGIFLDALFGLIIALSCWVIIHSILEIFGYQQGAWIGL